MTDNRATDVVVVGGAAGAVIAHRLAEKGKHVTLLCRDDISGATDSNQKWLHMHTLACDHCVVASGAWTPELLKDIVVPPLPLIRKKCIVLVIKGERVGQVTVCLDIEKDDGTQGDVTLVPFKNETLGAGTDFRVLYDEEDRKIEDIKVGKYEVATLKAELEKCFTWISHLKDDEYYARVCIKTEHYNPEHPDVNPHVYSANATANSYGHGIAGLIVAIPGKASLMFDLAEEVAALI